MSIQRYSNGTIAFDFATPAEKVYTVLLRSQDSEQADRGVRVLVCKGHGEVRFVEEVADHVDNGFCQHDTWKEVPSMFAE